MKARRTIYIVIGSILILLNILLDIASFYEVINSGNPDPSENGGAFSVGYFIGGHIFLIIGLVLLRLAYKLNKKIKNENARELKEAIDELGT